MEERRISEEIELQSKLTKLLLEEKDRMVDLLMKSAPNAETVEEGGGAVGGGGLDGEKLAQIETIETQCVSIYYTSFSLADLVFRQGVFSGSIF